MGRALGLGRGSGKEPRRRSNWWKRCDGMRTADTLVNEVEMD